MRTRGFTLLEVVIAISILAFLSLFTVQAIQQALKTKAKVQKQIDKNSTLRDALRIMERDINMAFNYHDVYVQLYNMAQKARQKAAATPLPPPGPGQPPNPPVDLNAANPDNFKLKVEKVYTQFIGEPQQLAFTSLSNVRMMEDQKISSQAEIAYTLKPCRRRSTQESSSNCLWRRIANYIHDDITRDDGQSTVLLENVTEFKLRYLGPGRDDEWVDTWITSERGDDQTKNKFPYAVEITVEIKDTAAGSNDKGLRMTTVAAIRNPNNPPTNDPKDPANATVDQTVPGTPGAQPGTNAIPQSNAITPPTSSAPLTH